MSIDCPLLLALLIPSMAVTLVVAGGVGFLAGLLGFLTRSVFVKRGPR